jgi:ankyrin repeat protein
MFFVFICLKKIKFIHLFNLDMFFAAAKQGRADDLADMVTKIKDPNIKDGVGSTPLHYAAQGGHVECVNLLLKAKANINAINNAGDTPLHKVFFDLIQNFLSFLVSFLKKNRK